MNESHMRAILLPFLIMLATGVLSPVQAQGVIYIGDQKGFDAIQQKIEAAVYSGQEDVSVILAPGIYFFSEQHIKLYGKDWGRVHLSISGPGSVISAAGADFRDGDILSSPWDLSWLFMSPDGEAFDTFGETFQSPGLVKVVDEGQKLCRIRMPERNNLSPARCKDCYIQISRWYESRFYKVTQIRNGWVYFFAEDLEKVSPLGYNVNYDFLYGQKTPRFRLCNAGQKGIARLEDGHIRLPGEKGRAHCCMAATFLNIHNTEIGSICLDGLELRGNAAVDQRSLIGVYDCRCQSFTIRSCKFSNIKSHLFSAEYTDHITINSNQFRHCARHGVSMSATCRGAYVLDNLFDDCGYDWGPWACITTCGDGYRVSRNRIRNFGYVGIFVGGMESRLVDKEPTGIIEDNTLWNEPDFLGDNLTHTMMDSGAIYIGLCNDVVTVRRNYIHDIGGVKDNRGIFCDDGARNFDIYDNVILNIANSYSIDSRRVPEPEGARILHNVGGSIHDNLVNAPIRFEGNNRGDRCNLGINFLLQDAGGSYPGVQVKNISRQVPQRRIATIQGTKWETIVR